MKKIVVLLLLGLMCCNNATQTQVAKKEYNSYHQDALAYCKQNGFNESYYYLLDLSIHPGRNRFFVYDFIQKKVSAQNLVTHGSCDQFEENPDKWNTAKFSNRTDSHCSMLGKFKIGKRDYSSWGIHVKYWLHGLEKSNANAEKRVVVLHSWSAVSNEEIYPEVSPLSWGCPAVSNEFMRLLDAQLKATTKPVLLWIIN